MRTCRRGLAIILLCSGVLCAFGQQSQHWQGNAAVARSGEFASPGLYAASNAFALNTTLMVQNASTGQRVQVTVVQRIQDGGNIFLLLSEEAGTRIGLSGSQVIRVQASEVSALGDELSESIRNEVYSSDPDLNPAVSVSEEQLQPAALPEEAEQPRDVGAPVEIAVGDDSEAQPPTEAQPTPEEQRLRELSDRIPQKQLYMPPRQQELYALETAPAEEPQVAEAVGPAEEPEAAEAEEPPREPEIEEPLQEVAEAGEPAEEPKAVEEAETAAEAQEQPPRVTMPEPEVSDQPLEVALPGPEAEEAEEPSPEGTRLPVPAEESPLTVTPEEPPTEVAAEQAPAAAALPEAQERPEPVEEAPAVAAPAEAQPQVAVSGQPLPSKSYFVQLGAYSTRGLAERLAGDLTPNYSVTILPASSGGRYFYKVLVGPLNVDESGTLLYQFRSRGFKDAFIQYVE
ncbi:MAG: SPOR domain-containing protein [Spirochaetales bacterium]|nr:SPOR domain-containing protein [Spirochaetales bacterium]